MSQCVKRKIKRTCDEQLNLVTENGTDGVPSDALVNSGVLASDGLDFVDRLRREVGQELAVFHPPVLRLWISWTETIKRVK